MSDKVYNSFIKLHATYENKNLRILLTEFRKLFKDIKFDNLTFDNAEKVILFNLDEEALKKALFKIHYSTGMKYGRMIAKQIRVDNPKKYKPLPLFSEVFQKYLLNYFANYGGKDISIISETMASEVMREITNSAFENESVQQMQRRIYKKVNSADFYRWQALRIARTETSTAMNSAKEIAGQVSGVLFDKIWIGRNDGRERASHIAMNGKKVAQNQMFMVGGYEMKYPCDRTSGAPAKEIVNCRCTFGYVARRDASGSLIFTD